jgi:YVTN family beta-propeller protein
MHERFVAAGIAVAGVDVGESYGGPRGRALFTDFYRNMTERRGFAAKPVLLGRSRGGLMILSWAVEHPEVVAGIAGIYPVFDFRTYPGLDKAAPAYGMTGQELSERSAENNPIERLAPLANTAVPAFLIHGDVDTVVPLQENSAEFVRRYEAAGAGASVKLVVARDQGHNYWEGFFRCQELVDFTIEHARDGAQAAGSFCKLYVANSAGNDIHVIDTATNRVIKRIEVGPEPHGLAATAAGDRIFITIENVRGEAGELLWFDAVTDTVTRRMKVGPRPNQLACTPDGKLVYIPCDDASWWVVDTVTGEVLTRIATGGRPHNTLCSPDGKRMYLGPKGSYHVLIADAVVHKLAGEIPLSDSPRPIVLSRDEKRLYANVDTLLGFEVADIPSRKVIHRVEAEVPAELLRQSSRSHGIGLTPDQKEVWMCDVYHDRTYVFDVTVEPPRQVATIVMHGGGYWMTFSPDGKRCYISERIGNTVAVIDTASRETVARISVGQVPKRVLALTVPTAAATTGK